MLDMDGAIGPAGERFPQHLRCTGGPRGADDHLAAVPLAKTKRFFEGVGVGLVHLEAGVLFAHGAPRVIDPRLPFTRRHLLDAHRKLHGQSYYWCFLKSNAALVPPNPKEFDSAYSIFTGRHRPGT